MTETGGRGQRRVGCPGRSPRLTLERPYHTFTPQLAFSRVFDAPRALVFRAFTDPDHLATWWGPSGNSLPQDEIEFDVHPGGFQRWTEVAAAEPDLRVHVYIDLTELEAFEKLDATLLHLQAATADIEV